MILKEFVPNYIRNRGKSFGKNGSEEKPAAKPRTEIPGAIKKVADVPKALAKAGQRAKGKVKAKGEKLRL